ncbi:MAG: Ig-like domain-containing protein [Clostridia bacterium]|nr:Ig-like domain-containing protein [Clostridia bacterium]
MKKGIVLMLAAVALFMCCAAFSETAYNDRLTITGLPEDGFLCEETYYTVVASLDGKKVDCQWRVSDSGAARISSTKRLFTKNVDRAASFVLTAEHEATGICASAELTVVPNAKSVRIEYNGSAVSSGELSAELSGGAVQLALFGVVSPKEAGVALDWTSSDESVAEVDDGGLVTVKGKGKAKITVKTINGKSASITVYGYYEPKSISLSAPSELAVKETATLSVTVEPAEAESTRLKYTSSDDKTIQVNQKGEVRALRAGTAEITVSASNGVSASVLVECYKPVSALSFEDVQTIAVGETRHLAVTVKPQDAKYRAVSFYSKTPEIASVDEYGNVTGISEGTARIVAEASNGVKQEKSVRIKFVSVKSLVIGSYFEALLPGETLMFPVMLNPANASNSKLFFESSAPEVASVDENGAITAHAEGRARIICSSESKSCAPVQMTVRVKKDADVLPLEGVIVGLNPGHQITRDYTQLPVAPGSKQTKNANSGYAIGVKTRNPEYQITLEVSLILRDKLEALGATVVMTRTTNDVKINNIERAKMLNEVGCDIALQIHCNNNSERWRTGFFAYAKSKDLESQAIGDQIYIGTHEEAGTGISYVRRYDGYMSLNWSETPTVLLELGYMSNPEEDVLLGTREYQEQLAEGIAKGLVYYFD